MSQAATPAKGHPKGLYILFTTEMWERFNYYGLRAVLVLFCIHALGFKDAYASHIYGSYTSLVYLTALLGGFVADRYWGNSRSIITGGLVMALGEFVLFGCGTVYSSNPGLSSLLLFCGLGLMIAGNGFFKPNISSLVGQLYPQGDRRKDAAYTIFYMGINTGGALGPFVCALVGDTGNPADFRWAFLAAGIGMLMSVVVQKFFQHRYVVTPEGKPLGKVPEGAPVSWRNPFFVTLGLIAFSAAMIGLLFLDLNKLPGTLTWLLVGSAVVILAVILFDKSLTKVERDRIWVIIIVSFFVVFFWACFEQAGDSLTFFADKQTDRHLGLHLPKWIAYLACVAGLYLVYWLYRRTRVNMGPGDSRLKISIFGLLALVVVGVGYLVYRIATVPGPTLNMEELPASMFQSLNSLFVIGFAPVFAWMWLRMGKREPSSPTKMALGLLLLALGYLWIAWGVHNVNPAVKVSMIWLTVLYMLHTWGELSLSPIGLSLVNQLSPLRFASLLMAIWFLANAFANDLVGILGALYPEPGKVNTFLGYQVHNLYDFFMLFVIIAGTASLILFLLIKPLKRAMHVGKES